MPNKPVPQEITVYAISTALLVLDLNCRCEDPKEPCYKLINPVAKFLDRARRANMFIVYTAADRYQGTPEARMPAAFKQRDDEPTIFPPAFDKFYSGELQTMLQQRGIKTVIVCGASSNQAVMYTATAAVRPFGYTCVVPVDGLIARGDYEHEFTLTGTLPTSREPVKTSVMPSDRWTLIRSIERIRCALSLTANARLA